MSLERSKTPPAFRDALIAMAETANHAFVSPNKETEQSAHSQ